MIEHGKCRGLDLGLNLKRGGPTISSDFIVWRSARTSLIWAWTSARAYDDTPKRRLGLAWQTHYLPETTGTRLYKAYGSASL